MRDRLPPPPAPIPPPDRTQIERLNSLYDLCATGPRTSWRQAASDRLRLFLGRILFRQQEFNAALVDHINRNERVATEAHHASARNAEWVYRTVQSSVESMHDEVTRHQQALGAWERRSAAAVKSLEAAHHELRTSIAVLQQATQHLKHQISALGPAAAPAHARGGSAPPASAPSTAACLDSHKYVGFENLFRGSTDEIRQRLSEYLPVFAGARDVLDIGCGRGEFLLLLREQGVSARGIDVNAAMVEVCRSQGLDAAEADALGYLRTLPDGSLGGLFAAQVIEHLEPGYLMALLDVAFDKLRPGAPIVLETINPACWFAFFESFIRDITHVRPIHPDTLKYLLVANGFQQVDIRYRAPFPDHDKLQPLPSDPSLAAIVDTLNANVERLNGLLFTFMDYAAIGTRA